MNNEYKYILVSLIFLTLLMSLASVSAEDLSTVQQGEVTGGVDVVSSNPGDGNGELTYEIPDDVENLQYASLFIDTYTAGSSNLVYGSETNVTLISNGESEQIANEQLVASVGSADGEVYYINDHTTKCFADYYMTYNLTEKLRDVSGKITINVTSAPIEGYTYYNKIKLIGLVFAYDGGNGDKVSYWVDSGSAWSKTDEGTTNKASYNLGTINGEVLNATIDNFALSSVDGIYTLNGEELDESMVVEEGIYYSIYHKFNIIDKFKNGTNTLVYTPGEGSYSFRNVLSVLKINNAVNRSVEANLSTEYSNSAFAGTNNVLRISLTNNGEVRTNYIIDLYADGLLVNSSNAKVNVGESEMVILADNTIRPVTANTVIGADNEKINYTVKISDYSTGELLDELSINPALLYNGNLGKDLAYPAESIALYKESSVNGGIIIDTLDDSTYLGSKDTNRTDVWTINLDDDATIVNGFVYVAYNWDKSNAAMPVWTTTFNGKSISPVASYRDQSNLGTYGKYGYGLLVYDVSDLAKAGQNTFVLNKEANLTAVYPSTFVALYNQSESKTITTIYMFNGADLLSNANNFLGRVAASNNLLTVDLVDGISDAKLHVFAASGQSGEGNLIVNNKTFSDVWNGTSNSVDEYIVDLSSSIKQSNNVSFVATGSTILALEQFIVTEKYVPSAKANLTSEYSGTVFAGTNNVLKLNLTNEGKDKNTFVVEFFVDGSKVNSSEIEINSGADEILYLTDDKIRPVTKDTVNGVATTKVNYTVKVKDKTTGDLLDELSIAPTLLYNGNLGKDLAYPAENISLFNSISVNGDLIIGTMNDSTYLSSGATNRTDVWNIGLPNGAKLTNAFVYVAYNWDKSNATIPVWTSSFNGKSISPVASYRDQSNLGTYGKYGYGLLVYDVSDLAKAGQNTFVLNKEANLTAVYPSTFVALYNQSESKTITTIYMFNGADLLSNANNFLGRVAASNNLLTVDLVDGISDAKLHVFAASGQSGEGNLIVNNKTFSDVWNGTSNSVDEYIVDLGSSIKQSNDVSFVATGSTILALEQFIVFKSPAAKNSADLQKLIDTARAGSTLNLGNTSFADIANVNITKNLTITGGIISGKDGEAIFVVPAKSAGGPNKVNITGVNFKLNNGSTVVKATADNDTNPNSIDAPAISINKNIFDLANDDVVPESVTVLELDSERGILAPTNEIAVQGNTLASGIKPFEFEVTGVKKNNDVNIVPGGNIPAKQASQIQYSDMNTIAINQKIEGRAGEYFYVNLTDSNGKALVNKTVQIGFNGAIYNRTTNDTGGVRLQINLGYKGTYTFAVSFLGDDYYNGSFVVAKIVVETQKTKLATSNKSYKASAKTKTLTATLKDSKGNLISGKKVSFTVNGKSYTATTNAQGVATVKVSLSTKKTYSFTVKYAGDDMYTTSSASGKVVII